jgi:hypothetical protein
VTSWPPAKLWLIDRGYNGARRGLEVVTGGTAEGETVVVHADDGTLGDGVDVAILRHRRVYLADTG